MTFITINLNIIHLGMWIDFRVYIAFFTVNFDFSAADRNKCMFSDFCILIKYFDNHCIWMLNGCFHIKNDFAFISA